VDLSSLKAEQDGSVSFVVLPFTFLPDQHARYTLSAFTPIDAPPATITPCAPSWHYQSIEVRDRERERERENGAHASQHCLTRHGVCALARANGPAQLPVVV
jgi:hypothetical protein